MRAIFIFLVFVGAQFLAKFLSTFIAHPTGWMKSLDLGKLTSGDSAMGVSLLLVYVVCCILFGIYIKFWSKPMKGGSLKGNLYLTQLNAILAVVLWSFSLSLLLARLDLPDGGVENMFSGMLHNPLCLLLLCVVGPLTEELFFRSGILRELKQSGLPGWLAAVISAFAFAVVHGNLSQGIPAFIVGIVLGLLYLRSGDLKLCLPAHIANNCFAVGLMVVPGGMTFTESWPFALLMGLGILHLALAILNTWRALKS